jgi:hypothetical protein
VSFRLVVRDLLDPGRMASIQLIRSSFEDALSFHGEPLPLKTTSNGKLAPLEGKWWTSVTLANSNMPSGLESWGQGRCGDADVNFFMNEPLFLCMHA